MPSGLRISGVCFAGLGPRLGEAGGGVGFSCIGLFWQRLVIVMQVSDRIILKSEADLTSTADKLAIFYSFIFLQHKNKVYQGLSSEHVGE